MSAAHEHDYDALDARLTVVEAQLAVQSVLERNIRDLSAAVVLLGGVLDRLMVKVDAIDERVTRLEVKVDGLDAKVDVLDGKFDIMLALLQARDDNAG